MSDRLTKFIESFSIVKRGLPILTGLMIAVGGTANAQYCTPSYGSGGGCTWGDNIQSVTLTGQAGSNINDLNTGCAANGYDDRTAVVPAVDLMQGGTYNGTVSTNFGGGEYYRIWIDFDNSNSFDASEDMTGVIGPFGGSPSAYTLNIPLTAPLGQHRMRIRLVFGNVGLIDPCTNYFFGEAHDYLVNILPAPPCSGAPTITGVTPGGPISTCAGAQQTLTVSVPIASGYTIQWQESTNGGTSWTNVGTNSTNYSFTVTGNSLYQVIVTCTNSGLSDTSASVSVSAAPPVYAPIPYFQDFENWTTYCSNSDIPVSSAGTNWTNNPSTGDNSWRREDQGATANWSSTWAMYFPASVSGAHSARFPTDPALMGVPGNLDLYLDMSAQSGGKQLYFYHINDNMWNNGDSLTIWLSTNGGGSFTQIAGFDSAMTWKRRSVPINSMSAQTILRFQAKKYNWDFTDMGIDSVYIAPPCTGTPVAGTISPSGPINACPGDPYFFEALGTTMAGDLIYQWQQSLDNGVTWTNVTTGTGSNTTQFTSSPLYDTVRYRMYVVCLGSGQSDTTAPVILNISSPVYASLPYSEGFENWINVCDVTDAPSVNWLNKPSTGDMSWRRDDQGASANWFFPSGGTYSPASVEGNHSARFHSSTFFFFNGTGNLDLFVNCSGPGNKELQFYYINPSGWDSLRVMLSTNGGVSYTTLASYADQPAWTLKVLSIPSTSAQTIIRFQGLNDASDDIGIDYVRVLEPCSGTPVAGTVDSLNPCSGVNFNLSLSGTTAAGGLTYIWQESPDGVNWTPVPGGNLPIVTYNITTPTWFRAIVACGANADTSDPVLFNLATFYYCYCNSAAQSSMDDDIGNFNVRRFTNNQTIFNNGVANPLTNNPTADKVYTNYTGVDTIVMYRDTTYRFSVTQINSGAFNPSNVAVFMDLNRDGVYDIFTEQIFLGMTSSPSQQVSDTFTIPSNAEVGLTGVRVVLVENGFGFPDPCNTYFVGETEDYLARIAYPPCTGPSDAGTAIISDTAICPGFAYTLIDTTHENIRDNIFWVWESSTDNVSWTEMAGTDSLDTVNLIAGNTSMYYRLKMICNTTNSTTYSNVVHLTVKPPYACYCPSYADGGWGVDLSDIGAFSIGNFIVNNGGPHLNNPAAIRPYTAYENVVYLATDSIYQVQLYHIIKNGVHQDAKVTMFMDFNNNFVYDIPDERVWTGYTSASNVFINTSVAIPANAAKDVLTGMRVILNNNTAPNNPSDLACDLYTSGETEDFVVMFKDKTTLGTGNIPGPDFNFTIFPNPSSGRFTLKGEGLGLGKTGEIRVTSITGQLVYSKGYDLNGSQLITEVDLSDKARGVYLVELITDGKKALRKLVLK